MTSNTSTDSTSAKVALVTGAGSGVGRAAALELLAHGYHVVLAGRHRESLDETITLAGIAGESHALAIPTDVGDETAVDALFATIEQRLGRLDVLFNNAGRGAPAVAIDELPTETWRAVVDVNLHGMYFCARAAYGLMKRQRPQGGRIINNGSISAHAPRPFSTPYTMTKHAVTGLTKSLSLDGRADHVVCCQIDIGNAATPMTERMKQGVLQADGTRRAEPRMDVTEVGRAVRYMADLPLDVNMLFVTVMANDMPFVGRG